MIKETYEGKLSNKEIDRISAEIEEWGKRYKTDKKDILRLKLSLENALISILEKNEAEKLPVTVRLSSRFDSYVIAVYYGGVPFDPFSGKDRDGDEWSRLMLEKLGQKAQYREKDNSNQLFFTLRKKAPGSELKILIGALLAVIAGIAGPYIPENTKTIIQTYGLSVITDLFMRMLGIFSGLILFLAILNGICGMGSVSDFSKTGRRIIERYLGISFAGGALLTFIASFFFRFKWGGTVDGSDLPGQIKEIIMRLFPSNPLEPFLTANMLQIIFLAILFGGIILSLGERVSVIRTLIVQSTDLVTNGVKLVTRFLSLFIFASLVSMFWEFGFDMLLSLWKPFVAAVVIALVIPVIQLIHIYIKYHVSPVFMVRGLLRSILIGVSSASSIVAFPTIREELETNLGVDSQFIDFSYPVGMNTYASVYSIVYTVIVFYFAEQSSTSVSVMWFALVAFFCVLFTIATPNVSGGPLICVGMVISNLNIVQSNLALAGTMVVALDFYVTGCRVLSQALEVYLQAHKYNKIRDV